MSQIKLNYDMIIDIYELYYFSERTFEYKYKWYEWISYTNDIVEDNLTSLIDNFNKLDDLMNYIYIKYYDIAKIKYDTQVNRFIDEWLDSDYIKYIQIAYDSKIIFIYDIYTKSFIEKLFRKWLNGLFETYFIWGECEDILRTTNGKDCGFFNIEIMESFYDTIPKI